MFLKIFRALAFVSLFVTAPAFASGAFNPNPNLKMEVIRADSFTVSTPGAELSGHPAVLIVDPNNVPIAGLTVSFSAGLGSCFPLDPKCTPAPAATLGHFVGGELVVLDGQIYDNVITGADGVAVADTFVGGTVAGNYEMSAVVLPEVSSLNASVIGNGSIPIATFSIAQFSSGTLSAVPILGGGSLLLLALAVVMISIPPRLSFFKRTSAAA